jgi:hypothetical protein
MAQVVEHTVHTSYCYQKQGGNGKKKMKESIETDII